MSDGFWEFLERTAAKVATWPEWKTGTFTLRAPKALPPQREGGEGKD